MNGEKADRLTGIAFRQECRIGITVLGEAQSSLDLIWGVIKPKPPHKHGDH